MGVIKFLRDISGLFNWNTDDNPTSELTYMNAVKNWQETEKNLVDSILWQPTTAYTVGNQVKTPTLGSQYVLVCTTAGTSGANELDYTSVSEGDSVTDGTVIWSVGKCFATGTVTYDATDVVVANNSGTSVKSGTVTVIGGHIVLFDVVIALTGNSGGWSYSPCGEITNSALFPKINAVLNVLNPGYAAYACISTSGKILITRNDMSASNVKFSGMYWI